VGSVVKTFDLGLNWATRSKRGEIRLGHFYNVFNFGILMVPRLIQFV